MASSPAPKRSSITILSMALFFCLLLLLTWFLGWSKATQKTDNLLHDNWVRLSQTTPPEQVAIAAIDPISLKELGRWPWPRELQSLLFQQLAGYNIKAAVIDMLFIESSAEQDIDKALAESMSNIDIVILPILTEGRLGAQEKLPLPALMREVDDLGHILLPIDNDGIVRRVFLRAGVNTPHWSSLALSAYAKIEQPESEVGVDLPGNRQEHSGLTNNWEQDYEVRIPFYGPSGTIPNVSALSIINGTAPREALENKVVFVGYTSTGLDVLPTPVSALDQPVPGVEIHANIYSALVDGRLKSEIDYRLNVLVALVLFPLMLLVYSRAPPQWGLLIASLGALLPIFISFGLYRLTNSWYAPLSASIPLFISYILWSWNRLNYLNRFLERETALLAPLSQLDNSENDLLVDFFRNAERHLPIQGWRFSAKGQHFSGGVGSPRAAEKPPLDRWVSTNGIYSKRYPTPGKLEMSLSIEDETVASQLTSYIDTLARVKSRHKPPPLSGSIERLQINTLKLSDQVAGLRNISAVSDSILEGSPAGLIVWNAAGEMVRGNDLVFELMPSLKNDVLLIDFINLVTRKSDNERDDKNDKQRIQELILDSAAWQITYVDAERESVINFNTVGASLTDRLVCATVVDVSEIRSVERARSEMVDYLSHDLRSPLISALYLLEGEEDEIDKGISDRIKSNINRSLNMMDDLLHVSRADTLSADKFEEVLFNAVVDNALDQLLPQARSRNIQFEIETTDDDLWMNGDAASLERAVANVVGNAIKYSNEGGRVITRTERQGEHVLLEVSDEGVGIDPAIMGDLFTRFKRDAKVAKKFKGIGLGLALVAKVVTQHSGEVKAVSPGTGTTIRMLLPLVSGDNNADDT